MASKEQIGQTEQPTQENYLEKLRDFLKEELRQIKEALLGIAKNRGKTAEALRLTLALLVLSGCAGPQLKVKNFLGEEQNAYIENMQDEKDADLRRNIKKEYSEKVDAINKIIEFLNTYQKDYPEIAEDFVDEALDNNNLLKVGGIVEKYQDIISGLEAKKVTSFEKEKKQYGSIINECSYQIVVELDGQSYTIPANSKQEGVPLQPKSDADTTDFSYTIKGKKTETRTIKINKTKEDADYGGKRYDWIIVVQPQNN